MAVGALSDRSDYPPKDEIGDLSIQLARIDNQIRGNFFLIAAEHDTLRHFISDASHELLPSVQL